MCVDTHANLSFICCITMLENNKTHFNNVVLSGFKFPCVETTVKSKLLEYLVYSGLKFKYRTECRPKTLAQTLNCVIIGTYQ